MAENGNVKPSVILLPGFPGNDQDVLGIGKRLSEAGINAFIFNYSGTHKSEGVFNIENSQKDINAAYNFIYQQENILKYRIDTNRLYLAGYSYGGGMALTYAAGNPKVKYIISVAGNDHGAFMNEYNRNPEMRKEIDDMFNGLKSQPDIVRFGPGGTPEEIAGMGIMKNNPTYDLIYCASLLADKNILLFGGWDDMQVSIENVILPLYRALINKGSKNVKITAFQDSHAFSKSKDQIAQTIIEWIKMTPSSKTLRSK